MSNPQKAKGSAFERLVADYFISRGVPCERIPAGSSADRGDLWIPLVGYPSFDAKNHKAPSLGAWVNRAAEQAQNLGRNAGFVIHKRHGVTDPGEQFVTSNLSMFITMMEALR